MENGTNIPGSIPSVLGALRGANIVMPLITTLLKAKVEKLTVIFFLMMLIFKKTVRKESPTLINHTFYSI